MAEAILYAEKQVRERLGGLGHTKYYELLASGELRSVKVGRRWFVPAVALEQYIGWLQQQANNDPAGAA